MTAAELLVKCLETEGVRYVFGVPGEEIEALLFALKNSSIKFIPTRHEQGAAFMANVWGRLTGRAGVCLSTLGPGATNLITGLADAHLDKSPLVAITGQGSSTRLHQESHQAIDVLGMLRPITKWNTSISKPSVIPEVVRKAFKLAQTEKPGVTHIELPEDIAEQPIESSPITPCVVRRPAPDHKAITKAWELIKNSQKPVFLAGNGAIRKLASKHLRAFVQASNIPVVTTFMGKGAISDQDPHALSAVGLQARDLPLCALEAADCIVSLGYDIAEYAPERWNTVQSRPLIHIDFEPAEVYAAYQPNVEVVCDISAALWELQRLLDAEKQSTWPLWYAPMRKALEEDRKSYGQEKSITVPLVLSLLRAEMQSEDILISDVGAHKMWVGRNFPVYSPGTCIMSNGFAAMGIALPGGLSASLVYPERNVVAVMGDGGFLMNAAELETAKRIGAAFTVVVLNDNDYGLISWKQQRHRRETFGTTLTNPDYMKYAESFDIPVAMPTTVQEIQQAFFHALKNKKLNIIAINIDATANLALSKKLDSDICAFTP